MLKWRLEGSAMTKTQNEFRNEIELLNKKNIEYAVRIQELQASIKEKDALLKEIYHRVKNNLQVISSLLNLQLETTTVPSAKKVLIESATRVRSMSLVHEMLYQTENLAQIEMPEYIDNLFKYLYKIYNIDSKRIKFIADIDAISLNIDIAIPLGLIINELASNSFKHAFPGKKSGAIKLSLKKHDDKIILTISDNGIGIPSELNINDMTTLGMQLIFSLTKQLNGNINLHRSHGTTFILTVTSNAN